LPGPDTSRPPLRSLDSASPPLPGPDRARPPLRSLDSASPPLPGLDPAPLPLPGLDPDRLARSGRPPLLYLVPTFANPTGRSLPDDRRRALADLARRGAVTVIEDDTYRDLAYSPAPASLWELAGGRGVIRIGSFAKTVAPGLRLGWIGADPEVVDRLTRLGYVHSGGGVNHTTAMTMACFGRDGDYDRHLARLRSAYREQRDALVGALGEHGLPVEAPGGGWFVWLPLPAGVSASRLLPVAEEHGVSFVPGPVFYADGAGGDDRIRLSFSRLPGSDLATAAGRLATAVRRLAGE
jgi:2-aminoadipate transaminase